MKSRCLTLKNQRRQQFYSAFKATACFADSLQRNELDRELLAKPFSKIDRMRLQSSDMVETGGEQDGACHSRRLSPRQSYQRGPASPGSSAIRRRFEA
jgi:hypothetical protein